MLSKNSPLLAEEGWMRRAKRRRRRARSATASRPSAVLQWLRDFLLNASSTPPLRGGEYTLSLRRSDDYEVSHDDLDKHDGGNQPACRSLCPRCSHPKHFPTGYRHRCGFPPGHERAFQLGTLGRQRRTRRRATPHADQKKPT